MTVNLPRALVALGLATVFGVLGCSDKTDDTRITGPDFPQGEGRVYAITDISFQTTDGVRVAATYGRAAGAGRHPAVILVHDVGSQLASQEWLSAGLLEDLLADGYNALALDLRGHGRTPLPGDGRPQQVLLVSDLENMHLEVRAALDWLRAESTTDPQRVAVIGNGIGGNIAFVSMGAFSTQLRAAVALSPGFWDRDLQPLVVGAGIAPFTPHTILYMAGEEDLITVSDTQVLSYPDFARALASITQDPSVRVLSGESGHGLALLEAPGNVQLILEWLGANL